MEGVDLGMVNWARYQFALTAMYHWLFVPITLGLSFLRAFLSRSTCARGRKSGRGSPDSG